MFYMVGVKGKMVGGGGAGSAQDMGRMWQLLALPCGCVDVDRVGELLAHAAPPQVLRGQAEGADMDITGDAA